MSDSLANRLRADYHAVARCEKDSHYSPLLLEAAEHIEALERERDEARAERNIIRDERAVLRQHLAQANIAVNASQEKSERIEALERELRIQKCPYEHVGAGSCKNCGWAWADKNRAATEESK